MSKRNRDLVSSLCCAVVKEGHCSGRKGPGKGRSPAARTRSPLGSEARGAAASWQQASSSFGHGNLGDYTARHPWPVQPCTGAAAAPSTLNAPFLDPRGHQRACTGKRPVSRGEAQPAYNSGGDEAPFTSGVPHHTPPDLAVSAPLLSHTPTPVGSLVKGGE